MADSKQNMVATPNAALEAHKMGLQDSLNQLGRIDGDRNHTITKVEIAAVVIAAYRESGRFEEITQALSDRTGEAGKRLERVLNQNVENIKDLLKDNLFKKAAEVDQLGYKKKEFADAQKVLRAEIGSIAQPPHTGALPPGQRPRIDPMNDPDVQRMTANRDRLNIEVGQMKEIAAIRKEMAEYKLDPKVITEGVRIEDVAQALNTGRATPPAAQQR